MFSSVLGQCLLASKLADTFLLAVVVIANGASVPAFDLVPVHSKQVGPEEGALPGVLGSPERN